MAKELAGAVAVVTGGSSGIGRACARLLAARGAKVYVLARSKERLAAAVEEIEQAGGFGEVLVADVASPEELAQAAAKVRAAGESVDILIAGAGIMDLGPADQMPLSQYEAMMRVNYLGVVSTVQSFLPLVKEGRWKRIAIVSSLAARVSPPYFGAYSASKAAVTGFAHALRQELAREGIRVTLVHPGPAATPLVDGYIGGKYYPVPPGVPVISPDQVARAVWRGIQKGRREVFVPRRLAVTAWLAGIAPGAVDGTYRLLDRGKRGK